MPKQKSDDLLSRLRLPLVAAPMYGVSGTDLVTAACNAGVIGAFPTANAGSAAQLSQWIDRLETAIPKAAAPFCPNIIMRDPRSADHLALLAERPPEVAITSVGPPDRAIEDLGSRGALILADIATLRHAERAIAAGVDGLILLTAGAGGNTGHLNPFAFVRAVRERFDGLIVLAGGISDGVALRAAMTLGCDLAYAGTRFIVARESLAAPAYRDMVRDCSMDDILTTKAFTGLDANMLRPSILAAGYDPDGLPASLTAEEARAAFGTRQSGAKRWRDIWSAGHSLSGVKKLSSAAEIVEELRQEYEGAREARRDLRLRSFV